MSKISLLPEIEEPLTGAEQVVMVHGGRAKRGPIGGVVEELAQPYVDEVAAQAEQFRATFRQVDGAFGIAVTDSIGIGKAFFPLDGSELRLPHLRATSGSVSAGPINARLVPGDVTGVVFLDEIGITVPVGQGAGTAPALDEAAVQKVARPPNSGVIFGHSKSAQNSWGGPANPGNPNGGTARRADEGWFAWMDYKLKGSINLIHNAAIGGQADTDFLARVQADVIAKNAAWCFMMGGTCNSINAGLTAEQIIALQIGTETEDSSNSILGALQAAGMQTLWMTDPTWETGHANLNATNLAKLNRVNRALLRAQGYKPGLLAVDTAGVVVDPMSLTGDALANYLQGDDFIHQTPLGARAKGLLAAERLLAAGFPLMDILTSSAADTYGNSATSRQLMDNPLMLGTGGTGPAGGVVTGTIPDGYRIAVYTPSTAWAAGSISSTRILRSDGIGYRWVVTVNSAPVAGAQAYLIGPDLRARLATGDEVEMAAAIDLTGMANVNGHEFYSSLSNGAVFPAISTFERDATANWGAANYSQADLTGGVMRTGKATIPSATLAASNADMRFRLTFGGAGGTATVSISRAQYLKNS